MGYLTFFRIPFSFFCSIFSISVYIAYLVVTLRITGIPGDSGVKNPPAMQEMQTCRRCKVQSLGQEDPLEKEMATHSSILAWEIHIHNIS